MGLRLLRVDLHPPRMKGSSTSPMSISTSGGLNVAIPQSERHGNHGKWAFKIKMAIGACQIQNCCSLFDALAVAWHLYLSFMHMFVKFCKWHFPCQAFKNSSHIIWDRLWWMIPPTLQIPAGQRSAYLSRSRQVTILPRPERGWSMRVSDEGITMDHKYGGWFMEVLAFTYGLDVFGDDGHDFIWKICSCIKTPQIFQQGQAASFDVAMQRDWRVPTQLSFRLRPEKVGPKTMAQQTRGGKMENYGEPRL